MGGRGKGREEKRERERQREKGLKSPEISVWIMIIDKKLFSFQLIPQIYFHDYLEKKVQHYIIVLNKNY